MGISVILLPHLGIAVLSWAQILFSINRYRGVNKLTRADLWSLLIFLHSAFVRWIGAIAIRASPTYQILSSTIGATLAWISFVLIFNQDVLLPTIQQTWALGFALVLNLLWELSNRLAFDL